MIKGKVWRFGDNISTDLIIPGRFFHLRSNLKELAKHTFEDIFDNFHDTVSPGDIVVGGKNFGLGSSREHAAIVIKMCGISAILAQSFARIFYRNAINIGLPVIICDTEKIKEGDILEIELDKGIIRDVTQNFNLTFAPLPEIMQNILSAGGLVEYVKKYGL